MPYDNECLFFEKNDYMGEIFSVELFDDDIVYATAHVIKKYETLDVLTKYTGSIKCGRNIQKLMISTYGDGKIKEF